MWKANHREIESGPWKNNQKRLMVKIVSSFSLNAWLILKSIQTNQGNKENINQWQTLSGINILIDMF